MDFRVNRGAEIFLIIIFIFSICIAAPISIPVKKISGGEAHSLFLTESNSVWSCGHNGYWQLGNGMKINKTIPVEVNDGEMNTDSNCLENISEISAGWTHSLVLDVNGFVWAFGALDTGQYLGQLGNGSEGPSSVPVKVHGGEQNTDFLRYITGISAGRSGEHSLALDASGFCYAWGRNIEGQLGINQYNNSKDTPRKVFAGQQNPNHPADPCYPLSNIIAISAGRWHSMALEKIDSNDPNRIGRVYTFGDNKYETGYRGKLGTNNTVSDYNTTPVKVHGVNDIGYLRNIVAISAGWDHSMALEKIDANDPNCKGRIYTWGNNSSGYNSDGGRLGNGQTSGSSPVPVRVLDGDMNTASGYLENIIAISAGEGHSMALDANGYIWIWGDNKYGQLGNGTNDPCAVPVRVVSADGEGFLSDINYISAGYWHSLAVDKRGVVWVWGEGAYGRLGIGLIDDVCVPVLLNIYDVNVYNETHPKWYKRIQPAIDDACDNDVIIAYEGNYCEEIDFDNKAITLKSINPNDWSVVDNTRIYGSGQDGGYVINLTNNNNNCVISGLTIIYGNPGISCNNANPTINCCQIKNNTAGIYSSNSSNPTINRCRIENNGNGVYCDGAAATITDTFLNENSSSAIYAYDSAIVVKKCNIADNYVYGKGIRVLGGSADIRNNIIHHNYRGIHLEDIQSAEIRNNTIVYNYECGIYRHYGDDPNINSSIVWGNDFSNLYAESGSFNKVNYNCIQNYTGGGTGNITSNPQFRDVNDGVDDYHLAYDSNCIDRGDPCFNDANLFDIDGEERIMDGDNNGVFRVDIGADEFCPYDLSQDGFVNFLDFAVLGLSWQTSQGDADYNDRCDFYNDGKIDYKDLNIFCDYWLSPSDWADIGGQMIMSMASEQLLLLAGEGETASIYLLSDVNEPNSGDEVTVQVYSDVPLFCMGLGITITGDANITDAMSTADCNQFGWDPSWPTDPLIDPTGWVYISGVKWEADVDGVVGYIKFRYNSGQVNVSITEGDAFDANCEPVLISGEALTFGADPNES